MKTLRLGVIGCGVIAQSHLEAATKSPLIDVVAVADLQEQLVKETAEKFGVKTVYSDGGALIDDPNVEAVVLAMPTAGRTELALKAFANGKHVLTEKPVAMNADEVRRMIGAKGNLTAACCSSRYRFPEGAKVAADFIAGGGLGNLRVIRCRGINPAGKPPETPRPAWRLIRSLNSGGVLVNWGCYYLDYLLGITGWSLKPKTVFAQTWTVPPQFESHIAPGSDAETHCIALIRCAGGAMITLELGEYMPAQSDSAWQIIGAKGSLKLHMMATGDQPKKIIHDDTTTADGLTTKTLWEGEEDVSLVHAGPVMDFAEAVLRKRPPKTGLDESLILQQITDAVYESAETGQAVQIKSP